MIRMCVVVVLLAACSREPVQPDPVAAHVVTRTETVDVPVAAPREVPPELVEPLRLDQPGWQAEGAYCLDWAGMQRYLRMLSVLEHHHQVCRGYAGGQVDEPR